MGKKEEEIKGPSTQSTGTQGVGAVGVNHGTQQPQRTVAPATAQPVGQVPQQQTVLPNQISFGGRTINLQPRQTQPAIQPQGAMPQQVTLGNNTYQMPTSQPVAANKPAQNGSGEPSAAERNAQYEADRQYNQAVNQAIDAGVAPNAIRTHNDPNIERHAPDTQQMQRVNEYNQQQANQGDAMQKTLMERLDELTETPEKKAAREKREARQRKWAAISEGIANAFNVGGAVAGARPAQWKSGAGDLYANQEAEADKRRAEYREALKDLMNYRTALRNGDIAQARAIEEKRKNDINEYRIKQGIEDKKAADKLKEERAEAEEKRKDARLEIQQRADKRREEEYKAKKSGNYSPSRNTKKSPAKSGGRGRWKGKTAKQTKAENIRKAKAENNGLY